MDVKQLQWRKFSQAVQECRKSSKPINGYSTWQVIQIHVGKTIFHVNPFNINLVTGDVQSRQYNLLSGKMEYVPNIKQHTRLSE